MAKAPGWAVGGEPVYRRDGWICQYCGLDGKKCFSAWQSLSWDHLLPHGHHQRDVVAFIVTACGPCNTMLSRYSPSEPLPGGDLEATITAILVDARRAFRESRLAERRAYWQSAVAISASSNSGIT